MSWYRSVLFLALAAAGLIGANLAGQADQARAPAMTASVGHSPRPVFASADADLFHGYRCGADNCQLHQEGYQWAADHRIGDPRDCRGTAEEFIEGCLAYAGMEGPLGERGFDASFPSVPD